MCGVQELPKQVKTSKQHAPGVAHTTTTTTTTANNITTTTSGAARPASASASSFGNTPMIDDAEFARELNELSFQEREQVFDDIHGVAEITVETPTYVASCIQRFDAELRFVPQKVRQKALDRALFLKPSLETDTAFKLMFLRAEKYDARKAVRRLVNYFDDKLELFGEDKLVQKITVDDLQEEDKEMFESGLFVLLPYKDSAGRPIWFCDISKFDFTKPNTLRRCSWYQIMATLEDEAAQFRGICNVTQCSGTTLKSALPLGKFCEATIEWGKTLKSLPFRITSYHFCYDDSDMDFVLSALRRAVGKHDRLRLRAHFGSSTEVQYSLSTYGISCPFLSKSTTDKADYLKKHQTQYAASRVAKDKACTESRVLDESTTGIILCPNPNDVLVGRGRPYQNFSGNQMLHELIGQDYLEPYGKVTDGFQKTCIHIDVIQKIHVAKGGRFLERTSEGWTVVNEKVAQRKVGSAFRSKVAAMQHSGLPTTTTTTTTTSPSSSTTTLAGAGGGGAASSSPLGYHRHHAGSGVGIGGGGGSSSNNRSGGGLFESHHNATTFLSTPIGDADEGMIDTSQRIHPSSTSSKAAAAGLPPAKRMRYDPSGGLLLAAEEKSTSFCSDASNRGRFPACSPQQSPPQSPLLIPSSSTSTLGGGGAGVTSKSSPTTTTTTSKRGGASSPRPTSQQSL